jgi:hypothetical protein
MAYDPLKSRDEALDILANRLLEAKRERDYLVDEILRALEHSGDTREIILEYAVKTIRPKVTQ